MLFYGSSPTPSQNWCMLNIGTFRLRIFSRISYHPFIVFKKWCCPQCSLLSVGHLISISYWCVQHVKGILLSIMSPLKTEIISVLLFQGINFQRAKSHVTACQLLRNNEIVSSIWIHLKFGILSLGAIYNIVALLSFGPICLNCSYLWTGTKRLL